MAISAVLGDARYCRVQVSSNCHIFAATDSAVIAPSRALREKFPEKTAANSVNRRFRYRSV